MNKFYCDIEKINLQKYNDFYKKMQLKSSFFLMILYTQKPIEKAKK
jgi:hypothetical protein